MKLFDIGEVPAGGGGGWSEQPFSPVLYFIVPETRPNNVVSICLNIIQFPVNVFNIACECVLFCPLYDIKMRGGGGGLEQSGDV